MQHNHEVDIIKADSREYIVYCVQCGRKFEAARADAAFCSAKCRMRQSREPQKRANAMETLRAAGINARGIAERYSRDKEMFEKMLELRKQIDVALAQFEQV